MGIKNILQIIPEQYSLNKKNLIEFSKHMNISTIAVDGNSEIHTYFLDHNGENTFLDEIKNDILTRRKYGISEIWIFDHIGVNKFHIIEKKNVLLTRKKNYIMYSKLLKHCIDEKKRKKIQQYLLKPKYIHFKKLSMLLHELNIPVINAIKGYDGEHIASMLTNTTYKGKYIADIVLTADSDVIPYKARQCFIRRKNIIKYYNFNQICKDLNINYKTLVDCCIVLGCDFTPNDLSNIFKDIPINIKDILKFIKSDSYKYLNKKIKPAHVIFRKECDLSEYYDINTITRTLTLNSYGCNLQYNFFNTS